MVNQFYLNRNYFKVVFEQDINLKLFVLECSVQRQLLVAPSHAAIDLETSYEKSTCPGVSIKFKYTFFH